MIANKKAQLFSIRDHTLKVELPNEFDYTYNATLSHDGAFVSSYKNKNIYLYEVKNKELKILTKMNASPKSFFMNNTMLVLFVEKKMKFMSTNTGEILGELQPKFIDPKRKYFTPRIESVSITKNAKELYVLSDKGQVEHWSIEKKPNKLHFRYIGDVDTNEKLVSSLLLNPYNEQQLLFVSIRHNTIDIVDRQTYKQIKSLKSDRKMMAKRINISHDKKYLMAQGFRFVYIWNLVTNTLVDVIGSNKNEIYGSMFMPNNSKEILIIGKSKELWSIE